VTALTLANITRMKTGDVLNDTEVPGLQLHAGASAKSFKLYYRTTDGTQRRPKIGTYGALSIPDARKLAKIMLLEVASGRDPSAERAAQRAIPTMAELIDLYKEKTATVPRSKQAATTLDIALGHIRREIGDIAVNKLTLSDVETMHAAMSIFTPTQANRVLAHVSMLLNFAERYEFRPLHSNFCKLVRRNPENSRRRYLMPGDEAKVVGKLLRSKLYGPHHESALFIFMLLLTGARKDEIGNAKVADLRGNVLTVTEHKTAGSIGEKAIYLPDMALDMLNDPKRLPHSRRGYLVGVRDPKKFWNALRTEAGCPDLRMHDLRHTFASFGLGAGLNLSMIGGLLAHASPDTTKRYAHLIHGPAIDAVNLAAGQVATALIGPPAKAEGEDDEAVDAVE